jgi:hypothetical protein
MKPTTNGWIFPSMTEPEQKERNRLADTEGLVNADFHFRVSPLGVRDRVSQGRRLTPLWSFYRALTSRV